MKEKTVLVRANYGRIELRLKSVMDEKGMSRNQLAKRIDTRFEVVDKWYKGEVEKMDLDILARICYTLGCKTEDLIRYVGGKEGEGCEKS